MPRSRVRTSSSIGALKFLTTSSPQLVGHSIRSTPRDRVQKKIFNKKKLLKKIKKLVLSAARRAEDARRFLGAPCRRIAGSSRAGSTRKTESRDSHEFASDRYTARGPAEREPKNRDRGRERESRTSARRGENRRAEVVSRFVSAARLNILELPLRAEPAPLSPSAALFACTFRAVRAPYRRKPFLGTRIHSEIHSCILFHKREMIVKF